MTVVGATGYIGKAVVREAVRRGYATTAVARDVTKARSEPKFEGATLVQADVCDPQALSAPGGPFEKGKVDVVISCLASRTGSKKDSFAIDYQATLNCLDAARAAGARHFVLLSAFCVKSAEMGDPNALQFQVRVRVTLTLNLTPTLTLTLTLTLSLALTLTLTLARLVHYVAETEGLAHRTVDKKTVVLRHRGPCRPAVG